MGLCEVVLVFAFSWWGGAADISGSCASRLTVYFGSLGSLLVCTKQIIKPLLIILQVRRTCAGGPRLLARSSHISKTICSVHAGRCRHKTP